MLHFLTLLSLSLLALNIQCQQPLPSFPQPQFPFGQPQLPLSQAPSYYGEFRGSNLGYPPIPNLLPQMQAMNIVGATTEPRRDIPKQADGTDCPMPPECLCGRSGRKKREIVEEEESEIRCTSGKLRRVVEKAISEVGKEGVQFDLGVNTLQNYVLFCQSEKFHQLQFSTDSTKYCQVSRGPINCLIIQH